MITIITEKKVINILGLKEGRKPRVDVLAKIMERQARWLSSSASQFKRKKSGITYIDRVSNEAKRLI